MAPPGFQTQCLLKLQSVCQQEQQHLLSSLFFHSISPFSLSRILSLSFVFRPQITTSLRVWSVVGVPRWCWVKVEWSMRRERSRFSKAPGDLSPANTSQTTLISVWNVGARWVFTIQKQSNVCLVVLTTMCLHWLVFLKSTFLGSVVLGAFLLFGRWHVLLKAVFPQFYYFLLCFDELKTSWLHGALVIFLHVHIKKQHQVSDQMMPFFSPWGGTMASHPSTVPPCHTEPGNRNHP